MRNVEDKYFIALSDRLNFLIKEKGLEISDLAASANLDRKQIYRLINKENIPTLLTLIKICLAAGIEPRTLFDFKFDMTGYMQENSIFQAKPKHLKK